MKRYTLFSIALFLVLIVLSFNIFDYLKFKDFILFYIALQTPFLLISYLSRNQNKIVCDKCYHKNLKNSLTCIKCGNDIEDIVCPTCGGINPYNQKYCSECQTKLACGECMI